MFTATRVQVATYLLGVCPFSIAFLVFLNSSVSFVITDLIGREKGVGDVVGNLGFADELLALVACPLWGLLSDRIGVRYVRHMRSTYCQANIKSGLRLGLLYHFSCFDSVRPMQECVSSAPLWQAAIQSRRSSRINYGHGYIANYVLRASSRPSSSIGSGIRPVQ